MIATIHGRMKTAPRSAPTLTRDLTHSLDSTKEGLMTQRTQPASPRCRIWDGPPKHYQREAAAELALEGREPFPWQWIWATCANALCIEPDHLLVRRCVTLQYPAGLCIYCGRRSNSRDHLLPRDWTGDTKRSFVVTVPACMTCNGILGSTLTWSITERRAIAHARLRRKRAKVLAYPEWSSAELDELGPNIRSHVEKRLRQKHEVTEMLKWPVDPNYDARALQKSGLDDPWAMGLILPDDVDLHEYVRAIA